MPLYENLETHLAANEMIARFGDSAAMEAGLWANAAYDRGDTAKYEYWQWVAMDINERNLQGWRGEKARN